MYLTSHQFARSVIATSTGAGRPSGRLRRADSSNAKGPVEGIDGASPRDTARSRAIGAMKSPAGLGSGGACCPWQS